MLLLGLAFPLCAEETKSVDDFRAAAGKTNAVLTIPDWPQTPEAVDAMTKDAIAKANAALDAIGKQDLSKVTFKSTIVARDDLGLRGGPYREPAIVIKESNTSPAMRTAGENAVKVFQDLAVAIDYREDVYKVMKAFADTNPKLTGEDKKLFDETMRDYRRAGLALPPDKRKEVEATAQGTFEARHRFRRQYRRMPRRRSFSRKLSWKACRKVFSSAPGVKTGDDAYTVMANVTWHFVTVEENAKSEATRKKLYVIHDSLAKDTNVPVLNQMLALRNKIALRLGYKSWDDYQTEIKHGENRRGRRDVHRQVDRSAFSQSSTRKFPRCKR